MLPIPYSIRQLANGSLIGQGSKVAGSELIRQVFASDGYFHGHSFATNPPDFKDRTKTADAPRNAANSGDANLKGDVKELKTENPFAQPPVDLVTTSGSGLEPHITPGAAYCQVPRLAKARRLPEDRVRQLVDEHVEGLTLGKFRVNILALSLVLDRRAAK
jgi:potassium-transporting ATPase KdpC subunit